MSTRCLVLRCGSTTRWHKHADYARVKQSYYAKSLVKYSVPIKVQCTWQSMVYLAKYGVLIQGEVQIMMYLPKKHDVVEYNCTC